MTAPSPTRTLAGRLSRLAQGPAAAPPPLDELVERLAEEMAAAWHRGERPLAEAFLQRQPGLADRTEAVLRLAWEEVCLRQELEPGGSSLEVVRRFPRWQGELRRLLDCNRLLGAPLEPAFPAPGETLGEFRLLAELGTGAQGRVYLATQPQLADRPVVLKVTPCGGAEHLSLARLVHTHIVPLHSAQDLWDRDLRVLCMPYLGGAVLGSLLPALASCPPGRRTGRTLLGELDRLAARAPLPVAPREAERKRLARSSYAEAVCSVGACLAEALHYAHERGLVHLDVKPSNVLLTADGQPMLLDFHLAREPVRPGGLPPDWLGGTPGYMSPEQEAALTAVRAGRPAPAAVDARSDVFSLGVLLYEALAGERPLVPGPGPLRRANPQVSPGLADVVVRCLARSAEDRYPSAAALADDLRRHLADLPLRGVPNRSLGERWRKWRRRRPAGLAVAVALAAGLVALVTGVGLAWSHVRQTTDGAEVALRAGEEQLRGGKFRDALATFQAGLDQVEELPGNAPLKRALAQRICLARRAGAAWELGELAGHLRFAVLLDPPASRRSRVLAAGCHNVWGRRALLLDRESAPLELAAEQAIRDDLIDLAALWSDLQLAQAAPGATARARAVVVRLLDEAERLLGPSAVLAGARRAHGGAARPAGPSPPASRSPGELWGWGRTLLGSGDLDGAARALQAAADAQPEGFWPHLYLGLCRLRQGRNQEAAHAFSVSIGRQPHRGECYFYRARANAGLGREAGALRDLELALRFRPDLGPAWLERGLARARGGRHAEALADFREALRWGADQTACWLGLAKAQAALGQPGPARSSLRQALKHSPGHAEALDLLGRLARHGGPTGGAP
jgi:serine/threonine protein kinase